MSTDDIDEIRQRLASVRVAAPPDRIDLDEVVRRGRRRRRSRLVIGSAMAVAVLTLGTGLALATILDPTGPPADTPPTPAGAGITADQLTGRWFAVTIRGHDVAGYRDLSGLPWFLLFGAEGKPNEWQVNRVCGPLVTGEFTVALDGFFTAKVPEPQFQSCPNFTVEPPNLTGVLTDTAFAAVIPSNGRTPTILELSDREHRVLATWRRDPTLTSLSAICTRAFGAQVVSSGPFTTVDRLRRNLTPSGSPPVDALPDVPGGEVAVYCWTVEADTYASYAVTTDGHTWKITNVGKAQGVPSGPPHFPA